MTWVNQIYYCNHCKNIVKVIGEGEGVLICCGSKMTLLEEQTADWETEKHVPILEEKEEGYLVKVGSTPHPMQEDHYITWISLEIEGIFYEKTLEFNDKPEAFFPIKNRGKIIIREVCNRHYLWANTLNLS